MDDKKVAALHASATILKVKGYHEEAAELTKPLIRKRDRRGVY
jgi:hypothetical protein